MYYASTQVILVSYKLQRANLPQAPAGRLSRAPAKKWPRETRGPSVRGGCLAAVNQCTAGRSLPQGGPSEAEIGQVTVANSSVCACHQRAIDRGKEPAEQGGRLRKGDGNGLGHDLSLVDRRLHRLRFKCNLMYTRCQNNEFVCMAAIKILQCNIRPRSKKKAAGTGGLEQFRWRTPILLLACAEGPARRNHGSPLPDGR